MRDALGKPGRFGRGGSGFIADIEKAIGAAGRPEERALLTGALINWQLERADRRVGEPYGWRNRFLTERTRALLDLREGGRYDPSEALKRLLREGGLLNIGPPTTEYMDECRAAGVPVPPNFSIVAPGPWVEQGDLTHNLLDPGRRASVWTFTHPERAGACIALPRDAGGAGSFTGIICQSAVTGKACFWDNMKRGEIRRIPTRAETMITRELQDGRTLDENEPCTSCHVGNNVYLMMPDDPTWAKLLRGPMNGPPSRNFTTVIDRPYTPIAYDSWKNVPGSDDGCTGSCHLPPSDEVRGLLNALSPAQSPLMPPRCATGGDHQSCYAAP